MRWGLAVVVVASSNLAYAEPEGDPFANYNRQTDSGVFVDIGGGYERNSPDGITYRSEYVRFAPQVAVGRNVYIGAGFDIGRIFDSYGQMNGMLPTQCSGHQGTCHGGSNLYDNTTGTVVEPQAFVGVRDMVSIVSGGFELVPTWRWTSASVSWLNQSFTTRQLTLELHLRADVWITPHVTAGLTAGMDYDSFSNLTGGLQIGFHLAPYDLMKERR